MLELIDMPADRVVGVRINGRIDTDSFDAMLDVINDRLSRHDRIRLYVELESLGGMSFEALFKDFRFALGTWRRFDREAVVTDRAWVQKILPIMDRLFPTIQIKVFDGDDRRLARQWINT